MLRLKIIATEVRHGKYMTHVQTTYLFSLIDNRFNGCRSYTSMCYRKYDRVRHDFRIINNRWLSKIKAVAKSWRIALKRLKEIKEKTIPRGQLHTLIAIHYNDTYDLTCHHQLHLIQSFTEGIRLTTCGQTKIEITYRKMRRQEYK